MTSSTQTPALLRLLPLFEFRGDEVPIAIPVRAQRLIALLAVVGRPLQRAAVAARLWPDVVNSKANASLRAALWSLPRNGACPVIVTNNQLALAPSVRLDLTAARDLATRILDGGCSDPGDAGHLLTEDLLPDWADDWLAIDRDVFRQLRLHALDVLCVRLAEAGRYARAIAVGLASVACEPTRESAHRALMTAHLLEGNRMEALRVYHRYVLVAREEMGIGPSVHLEALLQAALEDSRSYEPITAG